MKKKSKPTIPNLNLASGSEDRCYNELCHSFVQATIPSRYTSMNAQEIMIFCESCGAAKYIPLRNC